MLVDLLAADYWSGCMDIVAGDSRQVIKDTWCGMSEVATVVLSIGKRVQLERMVADIEGLKYKSCGLPSYLYHHAYWENLFFVEPPIPLED